MLASGLHFLSLQPEVFSHQITTSSRKNEFPPRLFGGSYLNAVNIWPAFASVCWRINRQYQQIPCIQMIFTGKVRSCEFNHQFPSALDALSVVSERTHAAIFLLLRASKKKTLCLKCTTYVSITGRLQYNLSLLVSWRPFWAEAIHVPHVSNWRPASNCTCLNLSGDKTKLCSSGYLIICFENPNFSWATVQPLELLGTMRAALYNAFHLRYLCCISGGKRLLQTPGTCGTKCDKITKGSNSLQIPQFLSKSQ